VNALSHGEKQRDRETEHKRLHFQICLFVYGNFLREALFVAAVVASRNYERFYCFISNSIHFLQT